jgi:hypothetical protein
VLAPLLTPLKALGRGVLGAGREYDELGAGLGRLNDEVVVGRAAGVFGRVAGVAPELQPRACADCVLDLVPAAPDVLMRLWSGCHFCAVVVVRLTLLMVLLLMLMLRSTLMFTSPCP